LGDWEFLVKDPLDGRTYYVRGGRHLGRLLRRLRNSAFLSARVRFPTTKTMASRKGELKPASWERRTLLEEEILEISLTTYVGWRGGSRWRDGVKCSGDRRWKSEERRRALGHRT
jgi:hypothetical protein